MATPPEEFYLAIPEPFSPSVFLDLPPTPSPRPDGAVSGAGGHPASSASSDDLVLPFISRMLMEEDIDDTFFYQYPDHSALVTAQQPYAQILSEPSSSSSDSAATTNTTTLSSAASGSAAAAEPTWPYDPIELTQLLRSPPSPDAGVGLDDFTADGAGAVFLPTQDGGAAPGFGQTSMAGALPSDGRGHRGQPASYSSHRSQSSGTRGGAEQDGTKTTLSDSAGEDHHTLASAFFGGGHQGVNMDMLNRAFAKGMEEAKKFLPANNSLLIDLEATATTVEHQPTDIKLFTVKKEEVDGIPSMFEESGNGRGRKNRHHGEDLEAEFGRRSKLMMPEWEDADDAKDMYRDIMSFNVEGFMKRLQDLRIAKDSESEKNGTKGARGRKRANEVVDLRTMLIHCAQAVASGDLRSANDMLKQIRRHSSVRGDATQRLAHVFAEALEARLAGAESLVYQSLMSKQTSVVEYLKAYRLFMAACCFKKVKHIFSNRTIQDAVAGKNKLHIVDYGVQHGFQWPGLLHYLANREGGPPEVRFTGIDLPQPGFRPVYQIEKTGERLSCCARQFRVPFKFHGIAAKWETVTPEDIQIDPDEVLVVNCECYLDKLMDESVVVDSPSPRDMVLTNIRNMRPNVFIHCVVNGTFGAPFFLTRFREALFFYSAQFDMLDATIPRDNDVRLMIEQDILGLSALNVIACEGADRLERPETYKQWHLRNNRAGLRQLPLRGEVVKYARDKVMGHYHKDFLFDVDHRWLLQGWKGRVLYALSTWVADDSNSVF